MTTGKFLVDNKGSIIYCGWSSKSFLDEATGQGPTVADKCYAKEKMQNAEDALSGSNQSLLSFKWSCPLRLSLLEVPSKSLTSDAAWGVASRVIGLAKGAITGAANVAERVYSACGPVGKGQLHIVHVKLEQGGSAAPLLARDMKTELGGFTYVKEVVNIRIRKSMELESGLKLCFCNRLEMRDKFAGLDNFQNQLSINELTDKGAIATGKAPSRNKPSRQNVTSHQKRLTKRIRSSIAIDIFM
ncbi:hypothetical protein Tco_0759640 [Tanacetum coccineum]